MKSLGITLAIVAGLSTFVRAASLPEVEHARELYRRTEYQASLGLLLSLASKDSEALQLVGQDYYMLGEYKKATDAFDHALVMGNASESLYVWAGRAYGRRAETSGPFTAAGLASKARKYFETAVQMDVRDREATGDLFDYYLGAPGFMGGGTGKAQELAQKVSAADPAEGQHLLAVLSEKNKDYDSAEEHLRKAIVLAPKQASRVMELARFLAKRGRVKESETFFDQAARMAPEDHTILFYRAETYVQEKRNLSEARGLLEIYLHGPIGPEDPPRQKAQELLSKASAE